MIMVLWHDEESAGYTDLFPENWFSSEGDLSNCVHLVRGPRGGRHKAKCNVTVSGAHADLDYGAYDEFNKRNEMELGVMRLQFESANRGRVTQVLWRDKNDTSFRPCSTTIGREQTNEPAVPEDIDLIEVSTVEGRRYLITHLTSERSGMLSAKKKKAALSVHGKLACEACGFSFEEMYGEFGKNFCEVHHCMPIAKGGERQTTLDDLAILCSNCHRMIHRTDPMLSVQEFAETYLIGKAARFCAVPLGLERR